MRPLRQQGVALITVLIIVALAVILATQIGFDSAVEQRRTMTLLMQDQAYQVGLGAEAWAASWLADDAESDRNAPPAQDHFAEAWAMPIPPVPIDDGQIEGRIEDLQGRFNINNLVDPESGGVWLEVFVRLLHYLEIEPSWAMVVRDWVDRDLDPGFPDGAEDNIYTTLDPPYRAPNAPVTSISELLALPQFGLERYNKLKPYITALPVGTQLNVCTAPGLVIDALTGEQEYSLNPEGMSRDREDKCFPTRQTLLAIAPQLQDLIGEQTEYFRLASFITIGGSEFSLYSLLRRDQRGRVNVIMRTFGAE